MQFGRLHAMRQLPKHGRFSIWGVVVLVLLTGLIGVLGSLVGLTLALGWVWIAGVLVAIIYAFILYGVLVSPSAPGLRDSFFWVLFALIFIVTSVHKFTGYAAYYALELSLILILPLLIKPLIQLLTESVFFRLWFSGLLIFFILSFLSSIFGRSHALPAIYQALTNLKVIIVLLLGFYLAWSPRTEAVFWWLVRWLWLPMILMIAWQWGHPSSYFKLMGHADPGSADPLQLFPSRGLGLFQHPSYLGLYAGIFTIFCVLKAAMGDGRRYLLFGFFYLLLLIASTQRQETAAAIIVSLAIVSLLKGKRFVVQSVVATSIVALLAGGMGWFFIKDNLEREATSWGLVGHARIDQPRQVLYLHAAEIADQYAPLGSGLGTFASAGAQKFDISLYLDRGFARYSWFYKENVLMDTYWTSFLAETGWGSTLFLMFLMVLLVWLTIKHSLIEYPPQIRRLWLMAFGGMAFMFILSLSSPSFQDPGLFLVPGIFLGVAYNRTAAMNKAGTKEASA